MGLGNGVATGVDTKLKLYQQSKEFGLIKRRENM